jgi:hypothetical protein
MGTAADADRLLVSKAGSPIYGQTDGVGVLPDAGGSSSAHDGLVAISNGSNAMCLDRAMLCEVFEDFMGGTTIAANGTGDAAGGPWFTKDTSAAGSPTLAISGDADNGQFAMAFSSTNESQILTLYWNDEQNIDSDQEPVVIYRLSVDATPTSGTKIAFGLASAQNDTLDSVAQNAWFLLAGADLSIFVESDDATTDSDDKDTGIDVTAATMYEFKVSCAAADGAAYNNVKFFYRSTLGGDWTDITPSGTTFKLAADTALQPFVQLTKNSAATDGIKIDYVRCYWKRN